MKSPAEQAKKQYKSISIIKAFACISVVVAHWKAIFESMGSPRIDHLVFEGPLVMLIYSSMGVSIFLMLSAALAALKVYRGDEIKPGEEVLKRYVRLSLPIFATSLIVLVLQKSGAIHTAQAGALLKNDWIATRYTEPLKILDLFRISFVTALLREENSFYIPFWMMSYIFLGSLASMGIALVIRSFNSTGRAAVYAFLLLATAILDSYYLCIICGNLLARLLAGHERAAMENKAEAAEEEIRLPGEINSTGDRVPGKILSGRSAVFPAAALLLFSMWFSTRAYVIAWNINAAGIGAPLNDSWFWQVIAGFGITAGFIVLFETLIKKASCFVTLMDRLGGISYEIFLTHWFVMCSFSCWFYMVHAADHMHVSVLLNFIISCALILACSLAYHFLITKTAAPRIYRFLRRHLIS